MLRLILWNLPRYRHLLISPTNLVNQFPNANEVSDDQAVATFGNAGGMRRNAACALSNAGATSGVGGLPAAAGMRRSPAAGMPTCAVDHSCAGGE